MCFKKQFTCDPSFNYKTMETRNSTRNQNFSKNFTLEGKG